MQNNYTILHCHTFISNAVTNIDSVTSPNQMIDRAHECGMKAMAISEHGSVMNWVKKKLHMEELGMKYIHAEEFYLTSTLEEKIRDNYHCLLIAKNYDGVLEINKLSSKSFNREDNSFYYVPRITIEDVKNTSDNVIVSTACLGGVLNKAPQEIQNDFLDFLVKNKYRCYLELQPHLDKLQVEYNKKLWEISKKTEIPLLMCTDTHALNSEHVDGRRVLQKSKNIHFDGEDNFHLEFLTYDELVDLCRQQNALPMEVYMESIENTNRVADSIEEFSIDYSYKYPRLWGDKNLDIFKRKIMDGIRRRGVDKYPNYPEYIARIKHEIEAYIHNDAIDFMLLMADIIDWCKTQDISVGYGRGSCTGSVVAYLLGITEMDSIKHNLNFERFMNTERVSLSDIDTDFPPERIDEVKKYIFNKHGLYCADIITFNTIALKGAIRDVGRAFDIPLDEVDDICDLAESNIEKAREKYPKLFKYVDLVIGCVVSVGNHPCFTENSLVYTSDGYKKIKDVKIGDIVMTHTANMMRVVDIMQHEVDKTITVYPSSSIPIETTPNHPFFVRKQYVKKTISKNGNKSRENMYKDAEWCEIGNIGKGDLIGIPINKNSIMPKPYGDLPLKDVSFWWLVGRYLGDGWIGSGVRHRTDGDKFDKYLTICCAPQETNDIVEKLENIGFAYRVEERGKSGINRVYIKNRQMLEYLEQFGKYAYGKFIPPFVMDMPNELLDGLFAGYMSADGCFLEKTQTYSFKTISEKLFLGLVGIVAKLYHRHCVTTSVPERKEMIRGRIVNCRKQYCATFTKEVRKKERSICDGKYIWCKVRKIVESDRKNIVYNLAVENDNSYTVNNVAVHNCGMIVAPYSIDDRMGIFTTTTDDVPISQINMKEVDLQNYVKLDLLKLDTASLINGTCKLAGIARLTPDNIDADDRKVWDSIRDDTTAIFQWESASASRYIRQLLSDSNIEKFKKISPKVDYMTLLSIGNGAIRPAGESYRDDLANGIVRKSGCDAIDEFMKPTFGYLVFQCQIINFLHEFCGYTMGEADIVRRHFAKKTGTEKDIPQIQEGFAKTMKEKYNMEESESGEVIKAFIKVIEDASNYLFSLNHSQPYSYEGYAAGWLRYYYPLEFLTTGFNIWTDDNKKTTALTKYANKHRIAIKSAKFRHSTGKYTFDKENNCIYKGMGSIKHISAECADQLYSIRFMDFPTFTDLLVYLRENTTVDARQIKVLTTIGFFSEFGKNKKLLAVVDKFFDRYKKTYVAKTKEARIAELKSFEESLPDEYLPLVQRIASDRELLGYVSFTQPELPKNFCFVLAIDAKYTPRVTLYCIATGKSIECKVDKKFYGKHKFKADDILYCKKFQKRPNWKKTENGFEQTGTYCDCLVEYDVVTSKFA